jgi:hypothetical protein
VNVCGEKKCLQSTCFKHCLNKGYTSSSASSVFDVKGNLQELSIILHWTCMLYNSSVALKPDYWMLSNVPRQDKTRCISPPGNYTTVTRTCYRMKYPRVGIWCTAMSAYTSPQREQRGITTARWRQWVRTIFLVLSLTCGAGEDNFGKSAQSLQHCDTGSSIVSINCWRQSYSKIFGCKHHESFQGSCKIGSDVRI